MELVWFVGRLTIKESYLYREVMHFELLTEVLVPALFKNKTSLDNIRILVAGCANGEESVSIAIALSEKFPDSFYQRFKIDGVDIDRGAIQKARTGIYSNLSFRSFDETLQQKYFQKMADGSYQFNTKITRSINYFYANLKNFNEIERDENYDIIFYRNVSIYFNQEDQIQVLKNLEEKLNIGGYLLTSSVETMVHNIGMLELMHIGNTFYFRKAPQSISTDPIFHFMHHEQKPPVPDNDDRKLNNATQKEIPIDIARKPSARIPDPVNKNHIIRDTISYLLKLSLDCLQNKKYEDSLVFSEKVIGLDKTIAESYVLRASSLIHLRKFQEAIETCERLIEIDHWNIEGRLLLAFAYQYENQNENMEKYLLQVIYLKPDLWVAHFLLARLYSSKKENSRAYTEYQITQRLIEKIGEIDKGYYMVFPLTFNKPDVLFFCASELRKLESAGIHNGN